MNLTISMQKGRVPVAVIYVEGKLDSNSFQVLINEVQKAYAGGARDLVLDMSKLTYLSSAGIVSLHSISKLFRGEEIPDPEKGWSAIRAVEKERESGMQQHVKLSGIRPEVKSVLEVVGFSELFEMYEDAEKAVASF